MYNVGEDQHRIRLYQEQGIKGIALSVVSSVFMAAGLCLQKLVQKNKLNDPSSEKAYRNSTYIAGKCASPSSFKISALYLICLLLLLSLYI